MNSNYMYFNLSSKDVPTTTKFDKTLDEYEVELFTPTLIQLKKHSVSIFIYVFWFFITKGRYRILYVKNNNTIIHYTHILPKFFKFPFMSFKDLEIGPSWTATAYRGKKIFPAVIRYVVQSFKEEDRTFYILTHRDNISSQKAIKKAGFRYWKNGYKTKKLGIYCVERK